MDRAGFAPAGGGISASVAMVGNGWAVSCLDPPMLSEEVVAAGCLCLVCCKCCGCGQANNTNKKICLPHGNQRVGEYFILVESLARRRY